MTQAKRYAAFLEGLSPETLTVLPLYVAADVHFADPFHDVTGVSAMRDVFAAMYDKTGPVDFFVSAISEEGQEAFLVWRFSGRLFGRSWDLPGASHVRFDDAGLVIEHVDYWDSGRHFLARLPVIGRLLRLVYRRAAAPANR